MDINEIVKQPEQPEAKQPEPVAPEPVQDAKPEAKADNKGPTPQVPIFELYKERDKRKQAETEANAQKAELERIRKEIEALKNPPQPEPDVETQPVDYFKHQQEKLRSEIEELRRQRQADAERAEAEAKQAQVYQYINAAEKEFEKTQSDYLPAMLHMRTQQYNAMLQQGVDPKEAHDRIYASEYQQALNFLQMGINPAEAMYWRAQQHYGYKKAEPQQPNPLQTIDAAAEVAKGGNKGGLGIKELLEAPNDQFDAMWAAAFPRAKKY